MKVSDYDDYDECEMIGGPYDGEKRTIHDQAQRVVFNVWNTFVPNEWDHRGNLVRAGHHDLHVYRRVGATFVYLGINAW